MQASRALTRGPGAGHVPTCVAAEVRLIAAHLGFHLPATSVGFSLINLENSFCFLIYHVRFLFG